MPHETTIPHDLALVFIELGAVIVGLAILTRLARKFAFSTIPLYLIAGLAFGNGGLLPIRFSQDIVHIGGEIGVLLLLFMLGLEYTSGELKSNLRNGMGAGLTDFALNFFPGLAVGLLLHWPPLAAVLLGGVTWVSSSGVIARVLSELGRMDNPETSTVLTVLVLEDLAMALYLPLVAVLLIGQGFVPGLISILVALLTVSVVLFVALRFGPNLSRAVEHESDEVVLFSTLGLVLLVAGVAQKLQVSSAIGAFLVGIALSGPIVKQTERLIRPLRDLFSAIFFLFFGLEIDPKTLPPVLLLAIGLGIVTTATKIYSGWWAARKAGHDNRESLRAGAALVARGEFSIVIAGLGAGLAPQLGPLSAAYVLFLAIVGPVLARSIDSISATFAKRNRSEPA